MTENKEAESFERKAWVSPRLERMEAGSAEAGDGTRDDGGPAGSAFS